MARLAHAVCPYPGQPHVMLATPCYTGAPSQSYVHSLVMSLHLLQQEEVACDHVLLAEHCHVDDARNALLALFIDSPCSDLIFIDADIGWAAHSLLRLIRHDADIVAGVYPRRGDGQDYPVYFLPEKDEIRAREDGLIEVCGAPTGFMRIRRRAAEKLYRDAAATAHVGQGDRPGAARQHIVFERSLADGKRWSGDYTFCRKWRAAGGKIHVDPEMSFVHEGTKEWMGSLGDHLRNRAGIDHPDLVCAAIALRAGDCRPETFVRLYQGWQNPFAAEPPLLATAYEIIRASGGQVLETGSGISTFVIALAAAGRPVHSLEHDFDHYRRTAALLKDYGIDNVVLHHAPLREYGQTIWYSVPSDLPGNFGAVFCDGPQHRYGRRGLFEVLGDRIRNASFIMDDADLDSQTGAREWLAGLGRPWCVINGTHRAFAVSIRPSK